VDQRSFDDRSKLLGKVSVRVDQAKSVACIRVLKRHVRQQGRFARAGLADHILVVQAVVETDCEGSRALPRVGFAERDEGSHAHQYAGQS